MLYYYTNMRANHLLCTKVPTHCLLTHLQFLGLCFFGIILVPKKRGRVAKVRSISGHLAIQDVGCICAPAYLFHVDDGAFLG